MSQEKVDRYKKEKANRKQSVKKEKTRIILRQCAVGVIGLALIGWIGFSAYSTYESRKPKEEAQIDYSALTGLQSELEGVSGAAE